VGRVRRGARHASIPGFPPASPRPGRRQGVRRRRRRHRPARRSSAPCPAGSRAPAVPRASRGEALTWSALVVAFALFVHSGEHLRKALLHSVKRDYTLAATKPVRNTRRAPDPARTPRPTTFPHVRRTVKLHSIPPRHSPTSFPHVEVLPPARGRLRRRPGGRGPVHASGHREPPGGAHEAPPSQEPGGPSRPAARAGDPPAGTGAGGGAPAGSGASAVPRQAREPRHAGHAAGRGRTLPAATTASSPGPSPTPT